uniref:Uncharacterized protein n=2 Tax=Triticum urartu TaxID=4572 RepID=A0A8R7PW60_TRIUA
CTHASRSSREGLGPRDDGDKPTARRALPADRRGALPQLRWPQRAGAEVARPVLGDGRHRRPLPPSRHDRRRHRTKAALLCRPDIRRLIGRRHAALLRRPGADEVVGAVGARPQVHGRGRSDKAGAAAACHRPRRHAGGAPGHAAHVEVAGRVARPRQRAHRRPDAEAPARLAAAALRHLLRTGSVEVASDN